MRMAAPKRIEAQAQLQKMENDLRNKLLEGKYGTQITL